MAVSDNNPERRNLNLTSLSIIIFFLAEGTFAKTIKLPLISISFSKPIVLAVTIWVMLFWFALRYWQTYKGSFKMSYYEDIKQLKFAKPVVAYTENKTGKPFQDSDGFVIKDINKSRGYLAINIAEIHGGHRNEDGSFSNYSTKASKYIKIEGFSGKLLQLYLFLKLALIKPSFGDYLLPYVLFVVAVVMGFKNLFS